MPLYCQDIAQQAIHVYQSPFCRYVLHQFLFFFVCVGLRLLNANHSSS